MYSFHVAPLAGLRTDGEATHCHHERSRVRPRLATVMPLRGLGLSSSRRLTSHAAASATAVRVDWPTRGVTSYARTGPERSSFPLRAISSWTSGLSPVRYRR